MTIRERKNPKQKKLNAINKKMYLHADVQKPMHKMNHNIPYIIA